MLGAVRELHSWSDKVFAPGDRPKDLQQVPETLDWDLWLGPAPERPYNKAYVPFHWRGWWDFGGGNLADMACHILDPLAWGLQLGAPASVEADGVPPHAESTPPWRIVRYGFPERNGLPPVNLTWYDGGKRPPVELSEGVELPSQGSLVVGEKGTMLLLHGNGHRLLPKAAAAGLKEPEKTLPRPPKYDHHLDFIQAIKTGGQAGSHFAYASTLSEIPLAGNVAYRAGKKLDWDTASMKAKNCPEADRFIKREYRAGWTL